MKTQILSLALLASIFISSVAIADRTVTIEEARIAVSNRMEQIDSVEPGYRVWVGIIPLSEYVRDGNGSLKIFTDTEVKFSNGSFFEKRTLSSGESITTIRFDLLVATFHMDVNMCLDVMTNNAVAFYFENRATQGLTRVRLEDYDSLIDQMMHEYYNMDDDPDGNQYNTALYCVIDGRRLGEKYNWFRAGDRTIEVHAGRNIGMHGEKTKYGEDVWFPVKGVWFSEVPEWLHIPTKDEIDYVKDGKAAFWQLLRTRN